MGLCHHWCLVHLGWVDVLRTSADAMLLVRLRSEGRELLKFHGDLSTDTHVKIYQGVPSVSNPLENHFCTDLKGCCELWQMGHRRVVSMLAAAVSGKQVSLRFWGLGFTTRIHVMKGFTYNWYLPCCQCTETYLYYFHFYSTQNNIYTPVLGVSSPVENCSLPTIDSLWLVCDIAQLMLIRIFSWMGHGHMIGMLAGAVGCE